MKANRLWLVGLLIILFATSALLVDRGHMAKRIEATGNSEYVYQFLPADMPIPKTFEDVPLRALLPAFILGELKNTLLIVFQLLVVPFVILALPFWGIRAGYHHCYVQQ